MKDTIKIYIDYLRDKDVPFHMKKHLEESYIKTTSGFLKEFVGFLVKKGANINTYKLSSINDDVVGKYCDYLEKKNGSNYTYNSKIKALKIFFNFLIDQQDYLLKNVWKKVKLKPEKSTNISISAKDFFDLLSVINPNDSVVQVGKSRKNMYRPWLKDAFKLKVYTGRRNAEIFAMRWNMIHWEDGMPVYIISPNIKVNKLRNNFDEKDFEVVYIPIGEELFDLLVSLGLMDKKYSYDYILVPDIAKRKAPSELTSTAFSFFFKKLNRNYTRILKHLRKTYITREDLFINSRFSMQHSNYRTTDKFYVDRGEVAKQMVKNGFRIFPEQNKEGTPVGHSRHKKRNHISVTP